MKKNPITIILAISTLLVSLSVAHYFVYYLPHSRQQSLLLSQAKFDKANKDDCTKRAGIFFKDIEDTFKNTNGTWGSYLQDHSSNFVKSEETCFVYYEIIYTDSARTMQSWLIKDLDKDSFVLGSHATTKEGTGEPYWDGTSLEELMGLREKYGL